MEVADHVKARFVCPSAILRVLRALRGYISGLSYHEGHEEHEGFIERAFLVAAFEDLSPGGAMRSELRQRVCGICDHSS